ncbi:hypothetical protein HRbin17_01748 [bacterium HR17]|jgi:uncharacterized membrane protein YeaQ/YmgE (transglycosylase-associated protein family)|uniref:GlsB/YeaQ/YmgE family stress response membrane protein n=1 Tax=Candidatus Fervidibacter japonicus TaxID=2035412 RepID=A0A2H5XDH5_9BACT|nr:hypothetical protein HRbin17_01748 [bacterium HR17]
MQLQPGGIIAWILVGLIAGWLAEQLTGRSQGLLGNIILGLVGAFVGGLLFGLLGVRGTAGFVGSIAVATIGAVVLIALARLFTSGRA